MSLMTPKGLKTGARPISRLYAELAREAPARHVSPRAVWVLDGVKPYLLAATAHESCRFSYR